MSRTTQERVDWLMDFACPHTRFRARRASCHFCVEEMLRLVEVEARVKALAEAVVKVSEVRA